MLDSGGCFRSLILAGGGSHAVHVLSVPLCTTVFPSGHDSTVSTAFMAFAMSGRTTRACSPWSRIPCFRCA